jgi:proteasome accessory factor B
MAESPQIIRQWSVLRSLAARRFGVSVQELAGELAVNERTIRRDLAALREVGFPIEERSIENGRKLWSVSKEAGFGDLTLNLTEVLSLYVGRQLMEPLAGTLFWEGTHSSYKKIRATLPDGAIKYLDRLSALLHFSQAGSSDYSSRSEQIDRLMVAVEDRNVTTLVYQSMRSTEPVSREVNPYGLAYFRGSLYLVAKASEENEIRHYKVDRITEVEPQTMKFERPNDFDLQHWMSAAFGVYRSDTPPTKHVVRFDQSVARFVEEKRWHHSQQLTQNPDGSLTAEFMLSDHHELMRWVMSFGSAGTAIEPTELVEAIRGEVQKLAESYAPKQDSRK